MKRWMISSFYPIELWDKRYKGKENDERRWREDEENMKRR